MPKSRKGKKPKALAKKREVPPKEVAMTIDDVIEAAEAAEAQRVKAIEALRRVRDAKNKTAAAQAKTDVDTAAREAKTQYDAAKKGADQLETTQAKNLAKNARLAAASAKKAADEAIAFYNTLPA